MSVNVEQEIQFLKNEVLELRRSQSSRRGLTGERGQRGETGQRGPQGERGQVSREEVRALVNELYDEIVKTIVDRIPADVLKKAARAALRDVANE